MLRFDWVTVDTEPKFLWHAQDINWPYDLFCDVPSGIIIRRTAGLLNNPLTWGPKHRICHFCQQAVHDRVYDYSMSKPKE